LEGWRKYQTCIRLKSFSLKKSHKKVNPGLGVDLRSRYFGVSSLILVINVEDEYSLGNFVFDSVKKKN